MNNFFRLTPSRKILLGFFGVSSFFIYKTNVQNDKKVQILQNFNFTRYEPEKPLIYDLKSRDQHIDEIQAQEYDCLIIGGGCNGSGVLLEGANRGLKCLLVEENDFSSGSSSKSSKMILGGIHYLPQILELSLEGNRIEKMKLLLKALDERYYMMDKAYYMNKALTIVIPCKNMFSAMYYYTGSLLYHVIYKIHSRKNTNIVFPIPKWMGDDELKDNFPHLDNAFKYGIVYYDAQFNDIRMNMDTILTSTLENYQTGFQNANVINYMRFHDFIKDESGKIIGAILFDRQAEKYYKIKANCIVNCTGAFADNIRKLDNPSVPRRILPIQGTHVIFPIKFTNKKMALLIPRKGNEKVCIIPWLKHTLIGTTNVKIDQPTIDPSVKYSELDYLFGEIAKIYPGFSTEYILNSVSSKWAGIRPIVFEEIKENEKVDLKKAAPNHVIEKSPSG